MVSHTICKPSRRRFGDMRAGFRFHDVASGLMTLAFAQKVGTIMAEVAENEESQTRFSYYI
jgi:hypothetical protein